MPSFEFEFAFVMLLNREKRWSKTIYIMTTGTVGIFILFGVKIAIMLVFMAIHAIFMLNRVGKIAFMTSFTIDYFVFSF